MPLVDTTDMKGALANRIFWPLPLAAIILSLDCVQNDESVGRLLVGILILIVVHGALWLLSRSLPEKAVRRRSEMYKWSSYSVVFIGGLWVLTRVIYGGIASSSIAYL